ncbi:MAG: glycosyltransferase [Akkermansia muciniphila]
MTPKRPRPVLAIAADLPLGRLLTSFRNKDRRAIPWIFSLFHALESQEDFDIHWITLSKAVSAPETIRMRNQTIHILPLGSMGRNILTAHFLTVRRIRKTLNDIQPDLLHVWGVEQAYALAGVAFRGKKAPFLPRSSHRLLPARSAGLPPPYAGPLGTHGRQTL